MIPLFQTMTVNKDSVGNCFNACVACILEKSLTQIPNILPRQNGNWHEKWRVYFASEGLKLVYYEDTNPPKGYSIATVTTDRIYPEGHLKAGQVIWHACVALDGEIVHDPYPEGSSNIKIFHYEKLENLSPAEISLHQIYSKYGYCDHGYLMNCEICKKD